MLSENIKTEIIEEIKIKFHLLGWVNLMRLLMLLYFWHLIYLLTLMDKLYGR